MPPRLAGPPDLAALTAVWRIVTEQDPTTPYRYLESRKDEHGGLFWKLARYKCAGYLNKCDFVVVYEVPQPTARHGWLEVEMKIVAMACWSFVQPTTSAYSSTRRKEETAYAEQPTDEELAKLTNMARATAWSTESAEAKKEKFDACYPDGYLYLKVLYVLPEFQRRGIGRSLTLWGMQIARLLGLPIALFASEAGRSLYEKLNFRVVDKLKVQAKGDVEVMKVPVMLLEVGSNDQLDLCLFVITALSLLGMLHGTEGKSQVMSSIQQMHAR